MTTTKRWKYRLIFFAALLISAAGHWAWHLLEADPPVFEQTLKPTVTTCLPPFCDEQDQQLDTSLLPHGKGREPLSESQDAAPSGVDYTADLPEPSISIMPAPGGHVMLNPTHTVCVHDPIGDTGAQLGIMSAWQQTALAESDFRPKLVVYINADIALEDFKAGKCQAAWLPGGLTESALPALDTLEAFGAVPTREHARVILQVLSSPAKGADSYRSNDKYDLMGVTFAGPAYLMFNKRVADGALPERLRELSLVTVNDQQAQFAESMGATAVPANRDVAATRFNNGSVDAMFATLDMLDHLELRKGLEPEGAIYALPLFESVYGLVVDKESFSQEQKDWSRKFFFNAVDPQIAKRVVEEQEVLNGLPAIQLNSGELDVLEAQLQQLRLSVRDRELYSKATLTLMRKVRCKIDASREECINPVE